MIHRQIVVQLDADLSEEEAAGLDVILEDLDVVGRVQELVTTLLESRCIDNEHPFTWGTRLRK